MFIVYPSIRITACPFGINFREQVDYSSSCQRVNNTMNSILRTLLVFVLLAAAGFAQKRDVIAEAEKFEQTMTKAEAGDSTAQYNLGVMYADGVGVQRGPAEARKWYRKAAGQGNAKAQYNLCNMYVYGNGGPKDNEEAFKWYRKAADQGDAEAQLKLSLMYSQDMGVPIDLVQAHVWAALADKNGAWGASASLLMIELEMTFDQKLEAAKKERALNAEPR